MPPVCFLIDHSFRYRTILWCSVSILMTDFDHRINSMGKSKSFWYRWHPYTVIGLSTFKFFLSSAFNFESKIEEKKSKAISLAWTSLSLGHHYEVHAPEDSGVSRNSPWSLRNFKLERNCCSVYCVQKSFCK